MTFSTRTRDCCGVSGFWVIGESLPFTFIDGGTPAVMNRSDAFLCAISFRKEVKSMLLMLAPVLRPGPWPGRGVHAASCQPPPAWTSIEDLLFLGVFLGLELGHQAPLDHVLQALVERLHAVLLAGLDRRVHLRDLVLADQVADGRGGHHDLVRRHAAATDL